MTTFGTTLTVRNAIYQVPAFVEGAATAVDTDVEAAPIVNGSYGWGRREVVLRSPWELRSPPTLLARADEVIE